MLGISNDAFYNGGNAEEQLKVTVVPEETPEEQDRNLFLEAARRVVFHNCLEPCGFDPEQDKYFDKKFYTERETEARCLFDCFSKRMKVHFGSRGANQRDMFYHFDEMKREYMRYRSWWPQNRYDHEENQKYRPEEFNSFMDSVIQKSNDRRYHRFDFH